MSKETPEKKTEALNEIIDNPDLNSSMFISNIRTLIDQQNSSNVINNQPEGELETQGD